MTSPVDCLSGRVQVMVLRHQETREGLTFLLCLLLTQGVLYEQVFMLILNQ